MKSQSNECRKACSRGRQNHAVAGSTPAPATTVSPATRGASFRGRPGSRAVPANFEPTEPARRSRRLAAMPCPARPRRDLGIFRVNGGRGTIYEREVRPVATVGRYVVKPIGHVCYGSHERGDAPPEAIVRRVPRQQAVPAALTLSPPCLRWRTPNAFGLWGLDPHRDEAVSCEGRHGACCETRAHSRGGGEIQSAEDKVRLLGGPRNPRKAGEASPEKRGWAAGVWGARRIVLRAG